LFLVHWSFRTSVGFVWSYSYSTILFRSCWINFQEFVGTSKDLVTFHSLIAGTIKFLHIFLIFVIMSINMIICSIPLLVAAFKKRHLRFLMPWLLVGATTYLIGIITICILLNVIGYIAPISIVSKSLSSLLLWIIIFQLLDNTE
jgi:hypothetical protein